MPKRAGIKMLSSTYVPAAKVAADLVLTLHDRQPEPPLAPADARAVDERQQPTLSKRAATG